MRKMILSLCCALMAATGLFAQNDKADNIIGTYSAVNGGDAYKVRVTKSADGTYMAQIFWVKDKYDKNGNVWLDDKNPDKSLRKTPCDRIVLFRGLKYDASRQRWGDTKVYDPKRGIKANMTATFDGPKVLKVRGSLFGISETEIWNRE